MVERIENETSKAQGQLEERSWRKEVRSSVRGLGVRNDEGQEDERCEMRKDGKRDGRRSCQNLKPGSSPSQDETLESCVGA